MGEWGIERLPANCFHKRELCCKGAGVNSVYIRKTKNMKFALKKKCHILHSSSIYWADQSRYSKSIYYYNIIE